MDLSIVLPCLNEEQTVGRCVAELREIFQKRKGLAWEILVVDNGSTDASAEEALAGGAKVVAEPRRGYGQALRTGLAAAAGDYVLLVDADGEHPLELAPLLYQETIQARADLGLASRIGGQIEQGAMPWSHRWLGTPVLTFLINRLFGGHIEDGCTGFRCVRRAWFLDHPHSASGMEFASENLIRALQSKAVIHQMKGGMRAGEAGRVPHLRKWKDGMRHVLLILAEKPRLFEFAGLAAVGIGSAAQVAPAFGTLHWKPGFALLTHAFALLAGLGGVHSFLASLVLYPRAQESPGVLARCLLALSEEKLFFGLLGLGAAILLLAGGGTWAMLALVPHYPKTDFSIFFIILHVLLMLTSIGMGIIVAHALHPRRRDGGTWPNKVGS